MDTGRLEQEFWQLLLQAADGKYCQGNEGKIFDYNEMVALQDDVSKICGWITCNHLTVKVAKTKHMIMSRRKHSTCLYPPLVLDGTAIELVSHFKYLGVWISDDLTWRKHIESVCCKARRLLGYMYRTFSPFCEPSVLLSLYKSQVLPRAKLCA